MTDTQHALLEVQEHDTEADQLRHRREHLPERTRLNAVLSERAAVEADGAAASKERDELLRRQGELESEVGDIDKRSGDIDRQMHSGAITASRDLQAMTDQVDGLRRRKSGLEDVELEIMEALEPVEARVAELQKRWVDLDREAEELQIVVDRLQHELDAQLAEVVTRRETAMASVPDDLVKAYERLRSRLGGIGVATLVGSSCGGCHLTLSASEIDRIRRLPADALVTCDQCGRILVR